MSISDPSGILQRVPELRELIDDAKIRHAIETGDPFRIYRALMLARLLRRLPAQRDLLKALTRERRLFARPLKGTPGLGTINSVGLSFVGQSERDDEGYHVALHAFVVLFALPLIPLGAYLVKSTGDRQWQIFARVPLGMAGWLYTRGLALLLVLSVLLGAGQSWHESGEHDLLVVNGFGHEATVSFAGTETRIPANGMATLRLKVGPVSGEARVGSAGVVDRFGQNLGFGSQTSIWNIAGAAPLLLEQVTYLRKDIAAPDTPPVQTGYCGKRFIEIERIDYRFVEPPKQRSMSRHETSHTVSHLMLYRDEKDLKRSGVEICGGAMIGSTELKNLAAALEAMAALAKWEPRATGMAIFAAREVSPAAAARLALRVAQAKPELNHWRLYREMAKNADQDQALRQQFTALLAKEPDNPDYHYLNATLLSGPAAINALQTLLQRFPDHYRSLSSLIWHRNVSGDYQGAARDLQRLHQVAPAIAAELIDTEVEVLHVLHQGRAALQLLDRNLKDEEGSTYARHAVDYLLLARQLGQNDADRWVRRQDKANTNTNVRDWLAIYGQRAGLAGEPASQSDDANIRMLLQLGMDLRNQPEAAMKNVAAIPAVLSQQLAPDQAALLLCEALRTGNAALARRMREFMALSQDEITLLQRYVQGQPVSLNSVDLVTELQAAAHFCRSRQASLPAAERTRLRAQAKQLDYLHGAISVALDGWPQS